jgi:redox-sensitive bicupin YhaK (pirin superfamily)
LRESNERGHVRNDWLESRHTFSFGDYYDPRHMGFRCLRVINEDWIQPGAGFPLHPHRDMEILTVVLAGTLQHEDDHGGRAVIEAGEVQRISAGRGIRHSEANPSLDEPVHLLQIWILPERPGLEPSYEMGRLPAADQDGLACIAASGGGDAAVSLHQNTKIFAGRLEAGGRLDYTPGSNRHVWLQMTAGNLTLAQQAMKAGDGAAVSEEETLTIAAGSDARFLLFDLP